MILSEGESGTLCAKDADVLRTEVPVPLLWFPQENTHEQRRGTGTSWFGVRFMMHSHVSSFSATDPPSGASSNY